MTFEEIVSKAPQEIKDMLEDLKQMRERPDYHPEPSAYIHVKIVTERLLKTGDMDLVLAGLFHDIGKFATMKINPKTGHPTSPGHELVGADLVRKYSDFVTSMGANPENVYEIVKNHMRIKQMGQMRRHKQEEIKNLKNFGKLSIFTIADNMLNDFDVEFEKLRNNS